MNPCTHAKIQADSLPVTPLADAATTHPHAYIYTIFISVTYLQPDELTFINWRTLFSCWTVFAAI